jgi:hypothetical protein
MVAGHAVRTLAAVICAALSVGQTAKPNFTSGVEGVRVDVLVTDHGRPLTGLTAADFELRDNGVR